MLVAVAVVPPIMVRFIPVKMGAVAVVVLDIILGVLLLELELLVKATTGGVIAVIVAEAEEVEVRGHRDPTWAPEISVVRA